MTSEQRYDLFIEWRNTSNQTKQTIEEKYQKKYGTIQTDENWEEYLLEELNMKTFWKTAGFL